MTKERIAELREFLDKLAMRIDPYKSRGGYDGIDIYDLLAILAAEGSRLTATAGTEDIRWRCDGCGALLDRDDIGFISHVRTGGDGNRDSYPIQCGPVHPVRPAPSADCAPSAEYMAAVDGMVEEIEWIKNVACLCDPCWTSRDKHAPDCLWDNIDADRIVQRIFAVESARANLGKLPPVEKVREERSRVKAPAVDPCPINCTCPDSAVNEWCRNRFGVVVTDGETDKPEKGGE